MGALSVAAQEMYHDVLLTLEEHIRAIQTSQLARERSARGMQQGYESAVYGIMAGAYHRNRKGSCLPGVANGDALQKYTRNHVVNNQNHQVRLNSHFRRSFRRR